MCQKQKRLAMDSENFAKPISLKLKGLVHTAVAEATKKGGPKMKVSLTMLLKTKWGKCQFSGSPRCC
jgi:hypothetical protein